MAQAKRKSTPQKLAKSVAAGKKPVSIPDPNARTRIGELVQQWKIINAQLDLDCLKCEGDCDDIVDAAHKQTSAIERRLLEAEPQTVGDIAGLMYVAIKILEEGGTFDQREIKLLERARAYVTMVDPDPHFQYSKAHQHPTVGEVRGMEAARAERH